MLCLPKAYLQPLPPKRWAVIFRAIMDAPDPDFPANFMATPHLFRHRYDINTVIQALCTGHPTQLDTGAGIFPLTQLPASFLPGTLTHPSLKHQSDATQTAIHQLATQPLGTLPSHFHTPAGDWLRARVKDAALEWLDQNDLIPPSMRHVPRQTRQLNNKPAKVTIA